MLYVTLVGQYPFERPEDKGDPQKMHKMIRRIVSVDYKLPDRVNVTPECKDLLSRILVSNPDERYTIQDIIKHPWFQTDLPSRALQMNDDYLELTPEGQGFQQLDEIRSILADAKVKPSSRKKEDDLIVAASELQS
eukprot:TRINITY_DN9605_c0_g1_i2.p3 TRINITY_DN9605_c0_g1~~TRINITY_DN9605_c0_g1_i2.p3  ORF type:complete len:136 (+),score=8.37 TRINITY_DN9605_c0_g1_i2:79-486(+)